VSRRELLQLLGVAGIGAGAGCYTRADEDDALIGGGSGGSESESGAPDTNIDGNTIALFWSDEPDPSTAPPESPAVVFSSSGWFIWTASTVNRDSTMKPLDISTQLYWADGPDELEEPDRSPSVVFSPTGVRYYNG
jgi:hypothetical protein